MESVTENGALKYWVEWEPRLTSIRAAKRNKNSRHCSVHIMDGVAVLCWKPTKEPVTNLTSHELRSYYENNLGKFIEHIIRFRELREVLEKKDRKTLVALVDKSRIWKGLGSTPRNAINKSRKKRSTASRQKQKRSRDHPQTHGVWWAQA